MGGHGLEDPGNIFTHRIHVSGLWAVLIKKMTPEWAIPAAGSAFRFLACGSMLLPRCCLCLRAHGTSGDTLLPEHGEREHR